MELCAQNRLTDMRDFHLNMEYNDDSQPLHQMVYHTLRYAIISGEVRPGEHLTEDVLSKTFRVSRTPVRAALIRLEQEELVTRRHGRTIVQDSLNREMVEIIETRNALERLAVATACRNVKGSDISLLREINTEFENALRVGDISGGARTDERFHEEIFRIADNRVLLRTIHGLEGSVYGYRVRVCSISADKKCQAAEHEKIIEALEKGNPQLAEQAVMRHINGQRYVLFDEGEKRA